LHLHRSSPEGSFLERNTYRETTHLWLESFTGVKASELSLAAIMPVVGIMPIFEIKRTPMSTYLLDSAGRA
jgi:hypothetical protein